MIRQDRIYHERTKVGKHENFLSFISSFRAFVINFFVFSTSGQSKLGGQNG